MPKSKGKGALNSYARYSSLAIQMFAIIALGTFAGVKLDEKYPNKHQAYTITLSLIAVLLAMFFVIRKILSNSRKQENEF